MSTSTLRVALFGRFSLRRGEQTVVSLTAHKLQQLLGYLLLYRDRQHPREVLADQFWGDLSSIQARTKLRKGLWELQDAINDHSADTWPRVLLIDTEWVQLNPDAYLWLDVAKFEQAFDRVKDIPGEQIDPTVEQTLRAAVELYHGDLLEGWYEDWCLYERERLQQMYLSMLDKLMGYCEAHQQYEQGLAYGERILRYDRAHEQTYRRLMRLHFLSGDRTRALRQFERCAAALREDLGTTPTEYTTNLCEQMRANQLDDCARSWWVTSSRAEGLPEAAELLGHLRHIQSALDSFQQLLSWEIQAMTQALQSSG